MLLSLALRMLFALLLCALLSLALLRLLALLLLFELPFVSSPFLTLSSLSPLLALQPFGSEAYDSRGSKVEPTALLRRDLTL